MLTNEVARTRHQTAVTTSILIDIIVAPIEEESMTT